MRKEKMRPDWLANRTIVVIDTNQPVTWHFADNLCAFCTGYKGRDTYDIWLKRFFTDMNIDPIAAPYLGDDMAMQYPNPFGRNIWPTMTDLDYLTPCCPWPNPNYGNNGLYDYVDYRTKATLNGSLIDPISLHAFNNPAYMSVAIFFINKLNELLFSTIEARAKKFCTEYPNLVSGKYHEIETVRYQLFASFQ